jgi:hypothetical protein
LYAPVCVMAACTAKPSEYPRGYLLPESPQVVDHLIDRCRTRACAGSVLKGTHGGTHGGTPGYSRGYSQGYSRVLRRYPQVVDHFVDRCRTRACAGCRHAKTGPSLAGYSRVLRGALTWARRGVLKSTPEALQRYRYERHAHAHTGLYGRNLGTLLNRELLLAEGAKAGLGHLSMKLSRVPFGTMRISIYICINIHLCVVCALHPCVQRARTRGRARGAFGSTSSASSSTRCTRRAPRRPVL